MKKIVFVLSLLLLPLFSKNIDIKTKILEKISMALLNKNKINIFLNDEQNFLLNSKHLNNVSSCNKADIVVTSNLFNDKCNKQALVFATNYLVFKSTPKAIGAFFYQKGRPNIIFRKEQLKNHNISLPNEFDKFIE